MNRSEPEVRVAFITAPDAETGTRIARSLVEERLVACVNLVSGIRSIYRWEGTVQEDAEVLLVAKTRADRAGDLVNRIVELHPYELPEVVLLPAVGGNPPYLDWVREEAVP
jgi:periplasmic divalent cation tolerance protein